MTPEDTDKLVTAILAIGITYSQTYALSRTLKKINEQTGFMFVPRSNKEWFILAYSIRKAVTLLRPVDKDEITKISTKLVSDFRALRR